MGRGVVSDEMGELANEKVLAFGGVGVQLPIFRPAGADVQGALENFMPVSKDDELDVICIEGAVCYKVIGLTSDVDDK